MALRKLGDFMCPSKVRVVWHYKNRAIACGKVFEPGLPPWPQSKRAFLPKRNRDDRTARDHVGGAVPMLADVMTSRPIIPEHQDAVEPGIDGLPYPFPNRQDLAGNVLRNIFLTGILAW